MNELTINIDEMLEQVAIAMAEGDNDVAKQLLPQILASGDETQQLMAESYQMQLDVLLSMESESEAINNDGIANENLIEDDSFFAEDPPPEFITPDSDMTISQTEVSIEQLDDDNQISQKNLFHQSDNTADTFVPPEIESTNTVLAEETTDNTSQEETNTSAITEGNTAKATNISQLPPLVFKTTNNSREQIEQQLKRPTEKIDSKEPALEEVISETVSSKEIEKRNQEFDTVENNDILSEKDESEVNLALEQVALLVDEGEYETANMLLQTIMGEQPDNQEHIADHQTAILSETSPAVADTEPQVVQEDLTNTLIEPATVIETSESQNLSSALGSPQASSEITPEELLGSQSIAADTTITSILENKYTIDDSLPPIIPKDEHVSHLLSPSQALGSFSFENLGKSENLEIENKIAQDTLSQRQGFLVGDIGLMIDFSDGNELTELPNYYRVPNAPHWLVGLTNLHGLVIPIFDLSKFLNNDYKKNEKPMLLVLQHDNEATGIIIDGLPSRLTYSDSQKMTRNTFPEGLQDHINAAYLINEKLWFDLDTSSLTDALEQSMR